ncbi:MAG TPA: GNAT family N-acetyltransferase [Thermoanaerobaculia bacterium]|jgi:aminoglycoside 6'-N-acetyltransferase|nr:GNAT family N-acetyltransferase [Thermoanaerobaculia bacterium]
MIDTDRLTLRRFALRDVSAFAHYRADPAVALYQSWSGMTLQEAHDFIAEHAETPIGEHDRWFQLAIVDKATDDLVGDIGICIASPGTKAEIGFSVAPSAQGRGYASEACRAAIDFIYRITEVQQVEAVIDARNVSAIALAKRLGMELIGTESAQFKGEVCSEHHFVCNRSAR